MSSTQPRDAPPSRSAVWHFFFYWYDFRGYVTSDVTSVTLFRRKIQMIKFSWFDLNISVSTFVYVKISREFSFFLNHFFIDKYKLQVLEFLQFLKFSYQFSNHIFKHFVKISDYILKEYTSTCNNIQSTFVCNYLRERVIQNWYFDNEGKY